MFKAGAFPTGYRIGIFQSIYRRVRRSYRKYKDQEKTVFKVLDGIVAGVSADFGREKSNRFFV